MIYVFFAHGYEEIEAITVVDVLRRAELDVTMIGVGTKSVTGSHGITVNCDILESEIELGNLEMIVLPGGMPGTLNLEKSPIVRATIDHAVVNNLWIGAICAATSILGHMGVVKGKRVTCFPGFESQLGGAIYTANAVEQDGKFITGNGPAAALEFSLLLLENITSKGRTKILADSMQWGVLSNEKPKV